MQISAVYSLGTRCYTEIILKRLNLIKFSSVFGSMNMKNYANIARCFATDFEVLFNEENLVFTKQCAEFSEDNGVHGFRTLNRVFDDVTDYHSSTIAHHDLSSDHDVEHFKRGVERLKTLRVSTLPILFVNISYTGEFNNACACPELVEAMVRYGFHSMTLLSIYKDTTASVIQLLHADDRHIIYRIPSFGYDDTRDDPVVKQVLFTHFNFNDLLTIGDVSSISGAVCKAN